MRFSRFLPAVALATLAGSGCDDATGPTLDQLLVLETVAGEALPATVEEAPGYVRVYRQDSIRLFDDDTWSRVEVHDFTAPGTETEELRTETEGTLEQDGAALVLDFVCNDMGLCIAPERLVPSGDGYVLERYPGSTSAHTLRYRVESRE